MQHTGRLRRFFRLTMALMIGVIGWQSVSVMAQDQNPQKVEFLRIGSVDGEGFPVLKVAADPLSNTRQAVQNIPAANWKFSIDNKPLSTTVDFETTSAPMAVAILVDTTFVTSDINTPQRTRFRDMNEQITSLINQLGNADITIISVAEESRVVFPLQADGGGARNALSQLQPGEQPENRAFDLVGGMTLGLSELKSAPSKVHGMFVFAVGVPEVEIDSAAAKFALDSQDPENSTSVAFILFGSDEEGTYEKFPSNKVSLERTAQTLNAPMAQFYANSLDQIPSLSEQVNNLYDGFINRAKQSVAVINAGQIEPGDHQLQVTIDNATAEATFTAPKVRPQLTLFAPKRPITATQTISVSIDYAQTPIEEVSYYLNNIPIGTSTNAPNFEFELDPTQPQIKQQFIVNEPYDLFAAADDTNNQNGRSKASKITLNPAKSNDIMSLIKDNILIVGIVGGLLVLGLLFFLIRLMMNRRQQQVLLAPSSTGQKAQSPHSGRHGPSSGFTGRQPAQAPAIDATQEFMPAGATEEFMAAPSFTEEYTVEQPMFFANWKFLVYDQPSGQPTIYPMGTRKSLTIGKDPGHEIPIQNRWISRNHATLQITRNGIEITDLNSKNGTFVGQGPNRERLNAEEPRMLESGDVFWVGPEIRAEVIEES